LARIGVRFDRDPGGAWQLGLEAAHGRRRIMHAAGDGTGREIVRALAVAVAATPSIRVLEGAAVRSLRGRQQSTDRPEQHNTLINPVLPMRADSVKSFRVLTLVDGRVGGLVAQRGTEALPLRVAEVVLATGGLGGLFRHTTNPRGSWGGGISLAARAGAALRGMEFVQFHPTALDIGRDPMPLVSEAGRGEGATLIDGGGVPVAQGFDRGDLEPRDAVSRAVWHVLAAGGTVQLDARRGGSSLCPLCRRRHRRPPRATERDRPCGAGPAAARADLAAVRTVVSRHLGVCVTRAAWRARSMRCCRPPTRTRRWSPCWLRSQRSAALAASAVTGARTAMHLAPWACPC